MQHLSITELNSTANSRKERNELRSEVEQLRHKMNRLKTHNLQGHQGTSIAVKYLPIAIHFFAKIKVLGVLPAHLPLVLDAGILVSVPPLSCAGFMCCHCTGRCVGPTSVIKFFRCNNSHKCNKFSHKCNNSH